MHINDQDILLLTKVLFESGFLGTTHSLHIYTPFKIIHTVHSSLILISIYGRMNPAWTRMNRHKICHELPLDNVRLS